MPDPMPEGTAREIIDRLRERIAAVAKGVPVNLIEGREVEIHPLPGQVPVIVPERHKGRLRGRLVGGTFKRRPVQQ